MNALPRVGSNGTLVGSNNHSPARSHLDSPVDDIAHSRATSADSSLTGDWMEVDALPFLPSTFLQTPFARMPNGGTTPAIFYTASGVAETAMATARQQIAHNLHSIMESAAMGLREAGFQAQMVDVFDTVEGAAYAAGGMAQPEVGVGHAAGHMVHAAGVAAGTTARDLHTAQAYQFAAWPGRTITTGLPAPLFFSPQFEQDRPPAQQHPQTHSRYGVQGPIATSPASGPRPAASAVSADRARAADSASTLAPRDVQSQLDNRWLAHRVMPGVLRRWAAEPGGAASRRYYNCTVVPLYELVHFRQQRSQSLTTFQPTPAGVRLLLQYCKDRHSLPPDVTVVETRWGAEGTLLQRLDAFANDLDWWSVTPLLPQVYILMDGQQHAVPVVADNTSGHPSLMILDSTAGSSIGIYREFARRHPGLQIWVNRGSRQVDAVSCITDAIEVALQFSDAPEIVGRIRQGRITPIAERLHNSRLPAVLSNAGEPANFQLFNLPEELCFTVQSRTFLNDPVIERGRVVTVNGEAASLQSHLDSATDIARRTLAPPRGGSQRLFAALNCYLYTAANRHARLMDALVESGRG